MPLFQSTRPAKGATRGCGLNVYHTLVSIHAPREGRDVQIAEWKDVENMFQSTRPAKGATHKESSAWSTVSSFNPRAPRRARLNIVNMYVYIIGVSIHAPREGRDVIWRCFTSYATSFNPRAPRRARLFIERRFDSFSLFQSTRPAKGATVATKSTSTSASFQSTRPAKGATR